MSTAYHSQYYAYELTKRCSSEKLEKLSQSLFNATVDMNPHQLEAALFAFRSPLSRNDLFSCQLQQIQHARRSSKAQSCHFSTVSGCAVLL